MQHLQHLRIEVIFHTLVQYMVPPFSVIKHSVLENRPFSSMMTPIYFGDFPASHVWWHQRVNPNIIPLLQLHPHRIHIVVGWTPIFIPLLVCYPHNFRESHIFGYIHIGGIPITLLVKFSKTSRMGGLGMPMYTWFWTPWCAHWRRTRVAPSPMWSRCYWS